VERPVTPPRHVVVWGILNAPATGLALAELIAEGVAGSVDLAPFDPARLISARPG
jgi:glycine/D-amino acid oxidase-like deaminating enzyme